MRDKNPTISQSDVVKAKKFLANNGFPEMGFLAIVDKADKSGYATYDIRTGKEVTDINDGYFVSFQVNKDVNVHRDYTAEEYDLYVLECVNRTGSVPYLGVFGNPEISFNAKCKKVAKQMMWDYNQKSIYDVRLQKEIKNKKYNKLTNPTEE